MDEEIIEKPTSPGSICDKDHLWESLTEEERELMEERNQAFDLSEENEEDLDEELDLELDEF
ncbi:hypothetical protein GW931_02725 [archaeon]|nr:hypothetical protein [archaeon]